MKVENYATEMGIDTLGSMADAFRHESYTPLDGKDDFGSNTGSNTIRSDMMQQNMSGPAWTPPRKEVVAANNMGGELRQPKSASWEAN